MPGHQPCFCLVELASTTRTILHVWCKLVARNSIQSYFSAVHDMHDMWRVHLKGRGAKWMCAETRKTTRKEQGGQAHATRLKYTAPMKRSPPPFTASFPTVNPQRVDYRREYSLKTALLCFTPCGSPYETLVYLSDASINRGGKRPDGYVMRM